MLDVHPPHAPTHTWRDFFIHIATIVVGLIIALGLEQAAEYLHHREQRAHLREDLRQEAEGNISLVDSDTKTQSQSIAFYSACLGSALTAPQASNYVTFTVPPSPDRRHHLTKPESSVWAAAKASTTVAVLTRPEIEAWDRVDYDAQMGEKAEEATTDASTQLRAITDHLGISLRPGTTIHITLPQRDELTRAIGLVIESLRTFMRKVANYGADSDAAVHGAYTAAAMFPFRDRAARALPN